MDCPDDYNTAKWEKELVTHLGGDVSRIKSDDCWGDFCEKFPDMREKAIDFFSNAKTGNPAEAAYWMRYYDYISTDEAMDIIRNAQTGGPARAARWMFELGYINECEYKACLQIKNERGS